MPDLLPYLIGGLANGALYGLLALGFVLVYRGVILALDGVSLEAVAYTHLTLPTTLYV